MCSGRNKSLRWFCTLGLFMASGGCMPQIIVAPAEEVVKQHSPAVMESDRSEPLPVKQPRASLTVRRVASATVELRPRAVSDTKPQEVIETAKAGVITVLPDVQKNASSQSRPAAFAPAPAGVRPSTGSINGFSIISSALFVLSMAAALLLVTRLIGRRSVSALPDKPLAKLLHTRPWR
jgi:hypothetical protein